jgi:hypothetical protein
MVQENEDPAGVSRGAETTTNSGNDNNSATNGGTHSKANGGAQDHSRSDIHGGNGGGPEPSEGETGNGGAQGQYTRAPREEPFKPLTFIDTSKWDEIDPPEPEYAVPGRVPAQMVTLFTGEGGTGKSLIAQQLCTAATLVNREWFGVVPWYGPTIFLDAEDLASIQHWRAKKIVTY